MKGLERQGRRRQLQRSFRQAGVQVGGIQEASSKGVPRVTTCLDYICGIGAATERASHGGEVWIARNSPTLTSDKVAVVAQRNVAMPDSDPGIMYVTVRAPSACFDVCDAHAPTTSSPFNEFV